MYRIMRICILEKPKHTKLNISPERLEQILSVFRLKDFRIRKRFPSSNETSRPANF